MELLARLFIRDSHHTDDPRVRAAYGTLCSAVAIALNILLAAAKFAVGTLVGSVSITADAMNNLSDVGSGALTLVGFRLSGKKPDLEHPFGHGRIEYVMGLVIAGLILYAGIDALRGALGKLLHPEPMEFTWAAAAVLVLSILVKIYMSVFYRRIGRKIGSTAMEMSGADALNDTISTALTLVCLLVYRFTGLDLDAYAGIIVAVLLLKTGYEGGKETLGQLLGQRPSTELAEKVRQIVLSYPEILAIHDLVIHDYGPGRCHVSLHAEVDGEENIYELHEAIDRAMSELDYKLGCFSVIHMDPVDTKNERLAELREETVQLLREIDPVLSLHDFRMVPGNHRTNLVFDVLVPFGYKLSDEDVRKAIRKAVEERHPDCRCVIQVDKSYT